MKTITLELDADQLNMILEALGALPFARVYELIGSIQAQARAQLQAPPAEAPSQAPSKEDS